MGNTTTIPLLMLLLSLVCCCYFQPTVGCIQRERESLLQFKAGLKDPSARLSSWVGHGCCGWVGVKCSNRTGHVVRLDLRNPYQLFDSASHIGSPMRLGGDIDPSLLGLKHLKHLDLSMNYFEGIQIPAFIGSLKGLRYMNLSAAGFNGLVPHHLGNLSSLRYLDLSAGSNTYVDSSVQSALYMDSGRWLSNLSSLQYLNLGGVDLSKAASSWLESTNRLPSLSAMHLSGCELDKVPLHLSHVNFTSLRVLDLSGNNINSTIPHWVFKITGLNYLDLSYNSFQNLIPDSIGNLTSLQVLDLSYNSVIQRIPATIGDLCMLSSLDFSWSQFGGKFNELGEALSSGCIKDSLKILSWTYGNLTGILPDWLGEFKNLNSLDLSHNSFYGPISASLQLSSSMQKLKLEKNKLNGTLTETIGQLFELVILDLSSNNLEGVISEAHFSNLTRLEILDLSFNSLVLAFRPNWVPPPHLTGISFRSCKLGPAFPAWLRQLQNLSSIDMSKTGISDSMPDWFWNISSKVVDIDLSHNEIKGKLPSSLTHLINLVSVDLSNNLFEGPLPQFSSALEQLRLSNNSISGTIYPNIGEMVPGMFYLSLSANHINGNIPLSICKLKILITLDFSRNHLSGEIPNCWDQNLLLKVMDLDNNNLSGGIPTSIGNLPSLQSLHLSGNDLSGELPLTLRRCDQMVTLDLGQNKLSGIIPTWIGESLSSLEALRLRSNLLVGNIPPQLGNLDSLQIIDLAHNNLSGTIPSSFGNLSAMKVAHEMSDATYMGYVDNLNLSMRGREDEYDALLPLVVSIDLANNNLIGWIPEELTTLIGLQNMNLSGNHLTGKLNEKISGLQWLESLDLSINNFSGIIPTSMTAMHSLNHLNLSFNQFSGKIPSGGQLQSLPDPSIYIGNNQLCGFPLNIKCQDDGTSQPLQPVMMSDDESDSEMEEIYLSMGVGFVVSCWTVYGTLLVKKKWRIAYFRFVDDMYDKIYVALAIRMAKMKNKCYFNRG